MTDPTALAPVPGFVDLRSRLTAGETLYGTFTGLGSPAATELVARAGFDWLIIDLEHGVGTESELLANLHAVGATRPPRSSVRSRGSVCGSAGRSTSVRTGSWSRASTRPTQAREAVTYLRYPPDGTRGVALSTRGAGMGELGHADVRSINPHILGIIQIESPSAVDEAAGIAAIDGVDVLFVGPADLSHSLGVPGQFTDPGYLGALERVARAADGAGKAAGILLRDASALGRHRDLGYRFIGLGSDSAFIADGARPCSARPAGPGRRAACRPRRSGRSALDLRLERRRRLGCAPRSRRGLGDDHPEQDEAGPEQLDGRQPLVQEDERQATMKTGSVVLTSAAWAAPMRRAPAYSAWIARKDAISPIPTR